MNDLESSLRDLRRLVEDELEQVRHALNGLDDFLSGDREADFMPRRVEAGLRTGTL